jgi:hypothetical protein
MTRGWPKRPEIIAETGNYRTIRDLWTLCKKLGRAACLAHRRFTEARDSSRQQKGQPSEQKHKDH